MRWTSTEEECLVSIPFKRESVFKAIGVAAIDTRRASFNSLQTGKRIQSEEYRGLKLLMESISFNSLQTGKRIQSMQARRPTLLSVNGCFNSLQTGKRIQSEVSPGVDSAEVKSFNSLQTGKRIQRLFALEDAEDADSVSIPFKRESVFKVTKSGKWSHCHLKGFNSLQTGKRIQRNF